MKRFLILLLGLAGGLSANALPPVSVNPVAATLTRANTALQAGEADRALALLQQLPDRGTGNAQAQNLACRIEYAVAQWDAAIGACQRAIRLDPGSSYNHLWLGRALGEKADKASFWSAFKLAKQVLDQFQLAAQLDPDNAVALSDLGEFYVEAPGVVGGGLDKAESVAAQLDRVDPVRAAELRAGIARQRGDYAMAESYLKRALTISAHPALQWATLARLYAQREQWADMDNALRNCESAALRDPHAAVALYDAAGVLIKVKRDPALAARLLDEYLNSAGKTEEAPAFVAYARLALLQQKLGDPANAEIAEAAASGLAREYQPLQDLRR